MKKVILSLLVATIFASCGNSESNTPTATTSSTTETPSVVTTIQISGGDDMKFDNNAFNVPVGKEITLTLTNVGKMPIESMGHNLVILKSDASISEFGNAAVSAKETDYVPSDMKDKVIAHTKILGPGMSETIKFTLDAAGDYPFLCSFPGHYSIMKGFITAK